MKPFIKRVIFVTLVVTLLSGCALPWKPIRKGYPGTRNMSRTEALNVLRESAAWNNAYWNRINGSILDSARKYSGTPLIESYSDPLLRDHNFQVHSDGISFLRSEFHNVKRTQTQVGGDVRWVTKHVPFATVNRLTLRKGELRRNTDAPKWMNPAFTQGYYAPGIDEVRVGSTSLKDWVYFPMPYFELLRGDRELEEFLSALLTVCPNVK